MAAAHHRLGNLTLIVDLNGQQALGYTRDVLDLPEPLTRWRALAGMHTRWTGTTFARSGNCLDVSPTVSAPHIVFARTIFGKGVSFMERRSNGTTCP